MEVGQIMNLGRQLGGNHQRAAQQLQGMGQVDPQQHAGLLNQLGIDPQQRQNGAYQQHIDAQARTTPASSRNFGNRPGRATSSRPDRATSARPGKATSSKAGRATTNRAARRPSEPQLSAAIVFVTFARKLSGSGAYPSRSRTPWPCALQR